MVKLKQVIRQERMIPSCPGYYRGSFILYHSAQMGNVLALLEHVQNRFTEIVKVFGRVPFFYYVLHFYIIHAFTVLAFYLEGYGAKDIQGPIRMWFRPVEFGYDLWAVYLIWIALVLLLYPLCRCYNNYKSTHQQWWLSYV